MLADLPIRLSKYVINLDILKAFFFNNNPIETYKETKCMFLLADTRLTILV